WEVSCQEIGSNIPFAAVSDLIAALGRYPAASGVDARWLAEAARVAPGLRSRYSGIPEPPPVPADAIRLRLAEALVRIIEVVAEDGPMLLVLDDLAYLDPASRDILHLLLRRLESAPLMVVASARTTEEQGLVATHHGSGIGVAWDTIVPLQPLDGVQVRQMVVVLCGGHAPGEPVQAALVDLAQGNPYVVEMLLSDWQRAPDDSLVAARYLGDETAARWCPPDSLHRVFARQHRGLSNGADRMLSLLAVAGRKLSAGDLGRLLGLDGAASDTAALELLDRGVVRIEDGGLSFKNQLHRSFVYSTMGDERRKFLHGQVGADLEGNGNAEFQDMLEAAHHYMFAGHPTHAVDTLIVGVELALSRGAPQEAAHAIERTAGRIPSYRRDELGVLLAEARLAQGKHADAMRTIGELDADTLVPGLRTRAALI
ncbi:MAG: AAA family ATPase, partial [Gemmatimonadales bacterium]|nr:AAA family ATPase [Gemmatimonadales bacterium]